MSRKREREERPNSYNGRGGYESDNKRKKSGMNMKKVFAISFCIVLGIVFISGGVIYKLGHDLYSNVNYVADEDVKRLETLPEHVVKQMEEEARAAALEAESDVDGLGGVKVSADELDSIHNKMSSMTDKKTASDNDIYNILLVGVDRRDKTWNGNSDSMILVSINKKDNRVTMVSLMRDTYVDIPDVGYDKLNAAYAWGAGPLLCETITNTYKVQVDRYAAVDFFDLIDIIDIIGGVDMEITASEAEVMNGYILDMCNLMNVDGYAHQVPVGGGYIHCDGVQAVAYARNRYVGNSDYQRTERQRYLIQQLMGEVKGMSVAQMTDKMQSILGHVTMNIPESEIWSMIPELPEMLEYKFETDRIPYDNMYDVIDVKGQGMLVPDWEPTIDKLHDFIYG
ncbi:MAG: LCP family protein [Lachnospiraceae bacterium]|jgi:LCP family protein required for cell wall assembly|nr:LCP family protein [Lachnospiraceae bacterium]RKJ48411.1 LytR family transcriptional regulator [bacterium 1XD42-54]